MTEFENLLADLEGMAAEHEVMAKALPAEDSKDNKKVQAAAAESGGQDEEDIDADGDNEDYEDEDEQAEEDEEAGKGKKKPMPFAKSFNVTLESGEVAEAVDATDLLKALNDRVETLESGNEPLAKSLTAAVSLIKAQGTLLKSLTERVAKFSSEGKGRKTMLAVNDRPAPGEQTMAKSQPAAMNGHEVLAKALSAQRAGKLTGFDVSCAEAAVNSGSPVPANVLAAIS